MEEIKGVNGDEESVEAEEEVEEEVEEARDAAMTQCWMWAADSSSGQSEQYTTTFKQTV